MIRYIYEKLIGRSTPKYVRLVIGMQNKHNKMV